MSARVQSKHYLDSLEQYLPILGACIGMDVERANPRELRVTNGISSCTVQFPAWMEDKTDLRPTLEQAAATVKQKTEALQEKYDA